MTPNYYESDAKVHRGRITKQRNHLVRWAAVEAVQTLRDGPIGQARVRIDERRGANIGKVAGGDSLGGGYLRSEFVVSAAEVLYEGVPGDDCLCGPIGSQSAHRSEPVFELTVIGFDRIVRVSFDVMPRRRDQVLEHARIDRRGVGDHLARCHLQHSSRLVGRTGGP